MKYFLVFLLLVACTKIETDGPDAQGYKWVKDGPVGEPIIHRNADVFLSCAFEEKAMSCAIHRPDGCHIYLSPKPEAWEESHELRHCSGWRHPDPLRHF